MKGFLTVFLIAKFRRQNGGISTSASSNLTISKMSDRVAIPIQLMNIHLSECRYYCLHLVPKFGDVRDHQNWWLQPTVNWIIPVFNSKQCSPNVYVYFQDGESTTSSSPWRSMLMLHCFWLQCIELGRCGWQWPEHPLPLHLTPCCIQRLVCLPAGMSLPYAGSGGARSVPRPDSRLAPSQMRDIVTK